MRCRAAFALLVAATGCDASLGPDGSSRDAAVDARRQDGGQIDASIDAMRVCSGGNAAALAPDNSCLVHVTTAVTYAAAKTACAGINNGHLAYLKTAALDTFAESFIGAVNTWIGASDQVTEGTFLWDDATPLTFTNWHTNEPNNGGNVYQEDCVIIAGERVGKQWDDRPCDASEVATSGMFAYLCQY